MIMTFNVEHTVQPIDFAQYHSGYKAKIKKSLLLYGHAAGLKSRKDMWKDGKLYFPKDVRTVTANFIAGLCAKEALTCLSWADFRTKFVAQLPTDESVQLLIQGNIDFIIKHPDLKWG